MHYWAGNPGMVVALDTPSHKHLLGCSGVCVGSPTLTCNTKTTVMQAYGTPWSMQDHSRFRVDLGLAASRELGAQPRLQEHHWRRQTGRLRLLPARLFQQQLGSLCICIACIIIIIIIIIMITIIMITVQQTLL